MAVNPIADPLVEDVIAEDLTRLVRLEATPEGVAVVTINRPHARNAFDGETVKALTEAFVTLRGADHVRIVFLRGEGGTFSSGGDLAWMRQADDWTEADHRDDALATARMFSALVEIPALTVALVTGGAHGGGAGLVAACDMAIADREARFSFGEVKAGLIPAVVSPYVVAAVGPRHARGLFASGRNFDAAHALAIGLVDQLVDGVEGLMRAQESLAKDALDNAPGAVADAKALVDRVAGRAVDHELIDDLARSLARRRLSEEGIEGARAFVAKRRPSWAAG